ncbi:hypothetical protein COBT_000480 [Conglomerata obtusa]
MLCCFSSCSINHYSVKNIIDRILIDMRNLETYRQLCERTKYDEIFVMELEMNDINKREDLNIIERYINAYEQYKKSDFYVTIRKHTTTLGNNLKEYHLIDFIQEASRLVENGGTEGFKNKYNKEPDPNISRSKYEDNNEALVQFIKDKQIVLIDNGLIDEDMFAVLYQELYMHCFHRVECENKTIILYLKFYSADEKRRWLDENPFKKYINEEVLNENFLLVRIYRFEVFASLRNKIDDTKVNEIDKCCYSHKIKQEYSHEKNDN